MTQQFIITSDDNDVRVDRWFKRHYPAFPHGELHKACRKGLIRLDGKKVKPEERVNTGQELLVKFIDLDGFKETNTATKSATKTMKLSDHEITETQQWVIYKNRDLIVLNKPAGLAVQGGSGMKDHIDRRLFALQFDAREKPKLVHRLDKDTSGVLVLARSAKSAADLSRAFASKKMQKIYWALVVGVPEIREGEIEGAIDKQGDGYEKMTVQEDGKTAITQYRVMEALANRLALVELQPITGRTHQLRVHMAEMGHPILGDGKYGGQDAFIDGLDLSRQLHLHARQLTLPPYFDALPFEAPLPKHMQHSFKQLGIEI